MVVCCKSTMPNSGRGRLTPSKRKFLRAAAILQLAHLSWNFFIRFTGASTGVTFVARKGRSYEYQR